VRPLRAGSGIRQHPLGTAAYGSPMSSALTATRSAIGVLRAASAGAVSSTALVIILVLVVVLVIAAVVFFVRRRR